ncbi:hypothetical protein CEN47_20945, partial [Fischerella thermalis CCMEE 5319]
MVKVKVFLVYTVIFAMIGGIISISSGHWNSTLVWVYAGVLGAILIADDSSKVCEDTKTKDESPGNQDYFMVWLFFPLLISHWIVAGLDIGRFHWSDVIPFSWQIVGLGGLIIAFVLARWAITVNRFYSGVIRLQKERGHYVISEGPYQYVRHPA